MGLDTGVRVQGLDASTSQIASGRRIRKGQHNGFQRGPWLPFVDGVFIPGRRNSSPVVTSTGLRSEQCPKTCGVPVLPCRLRRGFSPQKSSHRSDTQDSRCKGHIVNHPGRYFPGFLDCPVKCLEPQSANPRGSPFDETGMKVERRSDPDQGSRAYVANMPAHPLLLFGGTQPYPHNIRPCIVYRIEDMSVFFFCKGPEWRTTGPCHQQARVCLGEPIGESVRHALRASVEEVAVALRSTPVAEFQHQYRSGDSAAMSVPE
jgi:hypothetical protein